jgi:glycosyltransferase involved in cell wall biosynthesis
MQEKICIIIPCYNEQNNVVEVIEETAKHNEAATILIVNDGSLDRTSDFAKKTNKARVIDLPCNLGVGGAVQAGFMFAAKNDYDYAVKLDGDLQHPPEFVSSLINELKNSSSDIVIGSRFIDYSGFQSSFSRRIGIAVLKGWAKILTGLAVSDPTSGFRAYNRAAIEFMAEHYPSFDYPEPEELILACKNGFILKEHSVIMRPRKSGVSSISSSISLYYMIKVSLAMFFIALRTKEKTWQKKKENDS